MKISVKNASEPNWTKFIFTVKLDQMTKYTVTYNCPEDYKISAWTCSCSDQDPKLAVALIKATIKFVAEDYLNKRGKKHAN
uniref:Uncharacterized protein n=1 Tax=viral metagenome TaxID=1070528 RepID=A0A6M3IUI9_9ZZZZ